MRKKAVVQPISQEPELDTFDKHREIAASKLDLVDLDIEERAFLGTCQDLYRSDRGSGTPFEALFVKVVRWCTWGNPPTPEHLRSEIEDDFEKDWELTLHSVKRFMRSYPELIAGLSAPESSMPEPQAGAPVSARAPAKQPAKAQRTRAPRKKVAHA
jgi:hypothetical protein